jgi:biotin carboxyl carrier protein
MTDASVRNPGEPQHNGASAPPLDPRGVRVTVLAADDLEGVTPIVIEPAPVPLAMATPSTGVGLLGGVASDPSAVPSAAVEQRLSLDGEPLDAVLEHMDATRAIVREHPGASPHRILLGGPGAATGPLGPGALQRQELVVDGWRFEVEVEPAARAALRERARRGRDEAGRSGPTEVHAIIPGVVVSVSVTAGDEVAAGQQLLVVEAMKMQNELRAPRDGIIERVAAAPGETIEVGDLLLVIA